MLAIEFRSYRKESGFLRMGMSKMLLSMRMVTLSSSPTSEPKATLFISAVWKAQIASRACSIAAARAWSSEGSPHRSPPLIASYDNACSRQL